MNKNGTNSTVQDEQLTGGFQRRIQLFPAPGRIVAGLEDNLHRFAMEFSHNGRDVTDLRTRTERYPWTTCADAAAFLREQIVGKRLDELAELNCFEHCTHLFELAILCAAHSNDTAPTQYDLYVEDWAGDRTRVLLQIDGRRVLDLQVKGQVVDTPGEWFGRNLVQFSQWCKGLDAASAETAMLVGRAIYVSLGRASAVVERASDRGSRVLGVCFSYQPQRVQEAIRMPHSRREFSDSSNQLGGRLNVSDCRFDHYAVPLPGEDDL